MHTSDKRIMLLGICLLLYSNAFAGDKTFYVSPGICLSWDLKGNFLFSPKVSFGIYQNNTFYNVTIGRVISKDNFLYPYYYVECQAGGLSKPSDFRKLQLFTGGGVGFNIHSIGEGKKISFRASAFSGFVAFLKATIITTEKINADFGVEAVLPVPFNIQFNATGG